MREKAKEAVLVNSGLRGAGTSEEQDWLFQYVGLGRRWL